MTNYKIIKKFTIGVFIMLISISVFAQRRGNHIDRLISMQEELQLTNDQIESLNTLKLEMKEERKAFSSSADKSDRKEQYKQFKAAQKEKLEAILSPEQITALEEKRKEKKGKMKAKKEEHKALKKEIKAYHKQEIKPVLLAQREKLETEISADDKLAIDKLRSSLKEMKQQHKNKKKENPELADDMAAKKKHKRKRAGHHHKARKEAKLSRALSKDPALQEIATSLVDRYGNQVNALNEEISTEKEKWKADKKAIKSKYFSDDAHQKKRSEKMEKHQKKNEQNTFNKTLAFILLDPSKEDSKLKPRDQSNIHQLRTYPNPANTTQTIEFVITEAGIVSIDIIDKSGKTVKSVFQGNMDTGTHSLEVDVSDLKGDVFLYRINDKNGVSTEKTLINRN